MNQLPLWNRLTRRQQRVGLVVGGLLALLISDAVLLRPLRARLAQLNRHVRETERRLMAATVASTQAEAVNRAFEAYQPYVQPGSDAQSELGIVYAEIQSTVRDLGMPLINLKQGEIVDGKETVTVSLECEANPLQLVQLLDRLQRSTHLLKVTDAHVRVMEGKSLRVSLVISKLLLKAPA
jgi:type II secretory pathway component PulM